MMLVMKIINEDVFDISGFGGVRERVLLLDRRTFPASRIPDECQDGFAGCVYLANAWFLPRGETGMHNHEGMDIVSVIPRGQIFHQGSHGVQYRQHVQEDNGNRVEAGQVQLQRDGGRGIRHNELNPSDQVQPMMQVWIQPDPVNSEPEYRLIDTCEQGLTCVYGGELFAAHTRVDILRLNAGDVFRVDEAGLSSADETFLLFVWQGKGQITELDQTEENRVDFRRGDLIETLAFGLIASETCGLMIICAA